VISCLKKEDGGGGEKNSRSIIELMREYKII
jgi:hypothetical protein